MASRLLKADSAVAFAIQADLDAAGMKAFTPIEFLTHREVMPLEAQSRAAHAAVQMAPAVPDRMPGRTFGERRHWFGSVRLLTSIGSLGRSRHGDNVPIRNPGANVKVRRQELHRSSESGSGDCKLAEG